MSDVTVKDALDRYRVKVSILKKGYEQEKYRIDQISRADFSSKLVRNVTSVDIATYRDKRLEEINPRTGRPLATSTVRLEMSLLSNFFNIARIEWGMCDGNPVLNVRKPLSPPGRTRRLLPREERLILRYCHNHKNQDLYSIVVLALETAARQGEILGLHWEHISLKTRIAHLPETKNGTKRDLPLSLKARDALIRMGPKSKGRVFSFTSSGLKSTWRFMLIRLGISDLRFHDLRHESVSRLFELGSLDMMEVAAISGHKSLSMLKRYTHLKAQRLVKKLEGHRHRGKEVVINHMIPYPAVIETAEGLFKVRVLDFENLIGVGTCHDSAIRFAQDALLKRILKMIRDSVCIPHPDQYLEVIPEAEIFMIDPFPPELAT